MRSLEDFLINLATVRQQWNLGEAVEACARHGISAIDPWRDQVAAYGLANSAKVIKDYGMRVTGYCRGGMFPASDAASRAAAIDDNKRAVDEAVTIGAECLVMVVGGLPLGSRDLSAARRMVVEGLPRPTPPARGQDGTSASLLITSATGWYQPATYCSTAA